MISIYEVISFPPKCYSFIQHQHHQSLTHSLIKPTLTLPRSLEPTFHLLCLLISSNSITRFISIIASHRNNSSTDQLIHSPTHPLTHQLATQTKPTNFTKMQFTTTFALFATAAMAAQPAWIPPTFKRDVETFKGAFAKVGQAAGEVDNVVRAYAGGPGDEIECAVATLVQVAQGATRSLSNMTALTAGEVGGNGGSGSFHEASGGVSGAGDGLLADIESKVPLFAEAKICNSVMTWMMDMGENLGQLMKTAAAKFPADAAAGQGADGSASADIEHCRATFESLSAKLRACAVNGGAGTPQLDVPNAFVPSTPNTVGGNGTYGVHPPTSGAASFGVSGALAVAALAAIAL